MHLEQLFHFVSRDQRAKICVFICFPYKYKFYVALAFFYSMGLLINCDLKVYCALLSLPDETLSQSSNPKPFKKSRIWR